jgi:hypothetical protein
VLSWRVVALASARDTVAPGDRVVARVVLLTRYRDGHTLRGFAVGAPRDAIDWRGLDDASALLSVATIVAPGVWAMPEGEGEA